MTTTDASTARTRASNLNLGAWLGSLTERAEFIALTLGADPSAARHSSASERHERLHAPSIHNVKGSNRRPSEIRP